MNLAAYVTGTVKALGQGEDWPKYFDLSRKGFVRSFITLLLALPCYYVCAAAIGLARERKFGEEVAAVPVLPYIIIFTLYSLTFACSVYIIAMVFDKQDRFRPWVIVRHWAVFFAVLIVAALFGLTMLNVLPFMVASSIGLIIYLCTLAIDIRLAQRIGGFEWAAAVWAGCIITAMGFTVLLTGVAQFI